MSRHRCVLACLLYFPQGKIRIYKHLPTLEGADVHDSSLRGYVSTFPGAVGSGRAKSTVKAGALINQL